jgi:hypothetical protein
MQNISQWPSIIWSQFTEWPWWPTILKQVSEWQTLIAGFLALVGAGWTVRGLRAQIRQTEQLGEDRRRREDLAARAVLPLALSDMSRYARDCIQLLSKYVTGGRPIVPADLEWPQASSESIATFRDCARFADPRVATQIHDLLSTLQVQQARLRSLIVKSRGKQMSLDKGVDAIINAAEVHAKNNDLFEYARDDDAVHSSTTVSQLRTALRNSGIWEVQHPAHLRINQIGAPPASP